MLALLALVGSLSSPLAPPNPLDELVRRDEFTCLRCPHGPAPRPERHVPRRSLEFSGQEVNGHRGHKKRI